MAELLDFFFEYHKDEKWGFIGAPLHDPCTIAWLLKPRDFHHPLSVGLAWKPRGNTPRGMTVVDYYFLTGNKPNATVMVDVDRQGFVDLLAERLQYYAIKRKVESRDEQRCFGVTIDLKISLLQHDVGPYYVFST
ncbi:ribonucleoside hydrolase 1 [Salmonella enterica subsp. enterica serovar Daytona]|uniref:Ribonucleoside hydrolase 1 n=1 Tax=Salmonella enterica subsp. enterica serovar Daytona TaxID=1962639 RepID=A0A447JL99_SALET|nr:ribonucleoside hydrolase 1 [Salmonella enterica subsp. enterica serovar Daytona]